MENTPIPPRPRRADRYQHPETPTVSQTPSVPASQGVVNSAASPVQQVMQPRRQASTWNQPPTGYTAPMGQVPPTRQPQPLGQVPPTGYSAPMGQLPPTRQPQPVRQPVYQAPPMRRTAPAPAPRREQITQEAEAADPNRLPAWLTWTIVGLCVALLGLLTAHYLMEAYLTTRAEEWETARQNTLSYYHVVEGENGNTITYQALIERYAAEYNLRPAFVAAVIRNESSFRTDAESNVGARGLMQLMPDTAEWIAGKLGDSAYSFDRLYDAETNIRYGCWYLNYLSKLFRGDAVLVSSAYHAGQTTVTRWLSDRSISPDGVTIPVDSLPDGPTKQYAGRVTTSYGIYEALLYPEEAAGATVSAADAAVSARADR